MSGFGRMIAAKRGLVGKWLLFAGRWHDNGVWDDASNWTD